MNSEPSGSTVSSTNTVTNSLSQPSQPQDYAAHRFEGVVLCKGGVTIALVIDVVGDLMYHNILNWNGREFIPFKRQILERVVGPGD